uniref:Retrotransposon Copia-like N-terminal domain-containing protein n=1 Tax=Cannabis sativa TaxID=3483 RepID=A0A803NV39_CANSA
MVSEELQSTASMARPTTRSQDGTTPSTIDNPAADVTSDPIAAPHSSVVPRRIPPVRVQSQNADHGLQDNSTIVDDNSTQALHSRLVADDHSSLFFLSTGDHPGLVLVTTVLNRTNYQPWKRGITMELTVKIKIAVINGSLPCPQPGNTNLNSWFMCNNTVMSWLINSVSSEIAQSIMYYDLATEM